MTQEDKPVDLAAEILKKIHDDSHQPGTFRKHVFGTFGLTEEEYQARKRQLKEEYTKVEEELAKAGVEVTDLAVEYARWLQSTSSLPEHKLTRRALEEKMAFNANLPLTVRDYIPLYRPMMIGILGEAETRLMELASSTPLDRASKRIKNRSERLDKKLREPTVRHRIRVHFGGWPRISLCWRYIHAHKNHRPKRGNPWRSHR